MPAPATSRPASADASGLDTNRSGELELLVLVAERGSLSAVARHLGVSPSAVSKTMSRLEARLGVQLLQRSTRRVQLTAEGAQLYERGKRVLADLDEIEAAVAVRSAPGGSCASAPALPRARGCWCRWYGSCWTPTPG
jgi:DNA-binding transcriptional LysR family regulator